MTNVSPSALEALLKRRPFLKRFEAALDLAYTILLSPGGKRYVDRWTYYGAVGRPKQNQEYYQVLSTLFQRVDYYRVSLTADDGTRVAGNPFCYAVDEDRLNRWEAVYKNVHSGCDKVEIPVSLTRKAADRGWSFERPVRRDEMKTQGDRCYDWWVNLRASVRRRLFLETYPEMWDYDIQAAKPTLLLQEFARARQTAPWRHRSASNVSAWSDLVEDRTKVRHRLMTEADIALDDAKEVINVLLQGGHASPGGGSIRDLIGVQATKRLITSKTYAALQQDFKFGWEHHFKFLPGAQGLTRGEFMARFYNSLEGKVMAALTDEVDGWFVHDGFFCSTRQDKDQLEGVIRSKTGLVVALDEQTYTRE